MTKVMYGKNKLKAVFAITGHCDSKKVNGNDLCCCATSMMSGILKNYFDSKKLKNLIIKEDDAFFYVKFERLGMRSVKAVEVLDAIFGGFELLEELYPSNVCVSRGDIV